MTQGVAAQKTRPVVGETYTDHAGAAIEVNEVVPGDPQGREVRCDVWLAPKGREPRSGEMVEPRPYSCTLVQWAHRWRDRNPPTPPEEWTSR